MDEHRTVNGEYRNEQTWFRATLMIAAMNGYIDIIKFQLEKGARQNGKTAYDFASAEDYTEVCYLLSIQ